VGRERVGRGGNNCGGNGRTEGACLYTIENEHTIQASGRTASVRAITAKI